MSVSLTPLEKYTARQEELNKALKDGKILQADYNTLMAAAKKDYESTLKKPKSSGVKVSAGERQEDQAHAALLALETELRTLEKHSGANGKISQQRRDLWKAENQYAVLKEAATKRQLSEQEKSLLTHEKETLEYKRQLAELGDKVEHQKRLNELAQQAARFEQQQGAKQAAISAQARGLTDRQVQRESEEQRLRDVYGDNPDALAKATSALKNTWSAEEQLRGSWMAGLKSGWGEWAESATDSFSQVKSVATQTFDGIAQNMAAMLTGSEQSWRGFTRSVLSMLTEIFSEAGHGGDCREYWQRHGWCFRWWGVCLHGDGHSGCGGELPFRDRRIYGNRWQIRTCRYCPPRGVCLHEGGNQPDWRRQPVSSDARVCGRWLCGRCRKSGADAAGGRH